MPEKGTGAEKELYTISHIINLPKKHYIPVLPGNSNGRLGKAKYRTLRILMDSGASSSILLGKHITKVLHKKNHPVKWSTQGSDFLTTNKTNV